MHVLTLTHCCIPQSLMQLHIVIVIAHYSALQSLQGIAILESWDPNHVSEPGILGLFVPNCREFSGLKNYYCIIIYNNFTFTVLLSITTYCLLYHCSGQPFKLYLETCTKRPVVCLSIATVYIMVSFVFTYCFNAKCRHTIFNLVTYFDLLLWVTLCNGSVVLL